MPFPKDPSDNPATGLVDGAVLFGSADDDEDDSSLATGEQGGPSAETAAMKVQLDAMKAQMDEMRQQNMMLMSQPAPVAQQIAPMPRAVDPLPDPMEDAEGYAVAVRKSIMDELRVNSENQQTQQNAANKEQTKYSELWEEFQVKHKEYAGDLKQVRYAANIVAESAQKRGLDMEKYMFTYRDQFMADVKTEMNKIFGDPTAKTIPQDEPNKTDSVFGGRVAGSAAPSSKETPDDDPFKDIRDFQIRTGFHR